MKAILTVFGKDHTGIVAKVSNKLSELDINIIDISQTLMHGNFTMMMMVEIPDTSDFDSVKDKFEQLGKDTNLDIHVQRQEIFDATQKL
ncbi:ACT domain-containing protein [Companilactobacillus zhongbaensis]|uniref:ACT domain-containing protein n=1 Tax=Companilactobacillus zhongbaensis TaxID=2486009 RepID=UPI000F7AA29B|nr:ACT domain-containing protein [Companilactobacillus zhongbaensis]